MAILTKPSSASQITTSLQNSLIVVKTSELETLQSMTESSINAKAGFIF